MAAQATWEDHAQVALGIPLAYAERGSSLAHAALAGSRAFTTMRHYPQGDVVDAASGMRFYYHAHRLGTPEHGHFHLFAPTPRASHGHTHLVALSLTTQGHPLQWFTTNRWVTGETWQPAGSVLSLLNRYQVRTHGRLAPVARWLHAMVGLFRDDLVTLLHRRDRVFAEHCTDARRPTREAVFEDRTLEVLSTCPADLTTKILQPPPHSNRSTT